MGVAGILVLGDSSGRDEIDLSVTGFVEEKPDMLVTDGKTKVTTQSFLNVKQLLSYFSCQLINNWLTYRGIKMSIEYLRF